MFGRRLAASVATLILTGACGGATITPGASSTAAAATASGSVTPEGAPAASASSSGSPRASATAAPATPLATARATAASASVEVIARGLEAPWAIAFAPDGRMFVTERPGRVRVVQNGSLLPDPWATVPAANTPGAERGLMGIAIDPDFSRNGFVYLAYTYRSGTRYVNKLVRMRDSGGRGVEETVLLDNGGGGDDHDGGRVKIGPDGKLWWALGEAGGPANVAQIPNAINGKILRLELDGSVPADNPTRGSYAWSLGHRNVQGLAWHPDTRALYATEHGPSNNGTSFCCHDEVNLIVPNGNYGWPTVWGVARDQRFLDPVLESGPSETWAPSGAAFVTTGPYRGSLVFASLAGQHVHRVVFALDGRTVAFQEKLLDHQYGRIRDVVEGPDGALYVITSNRDGRAFPQRDDDRILKVLLR
jgi:glucose/arabinose dehydrogenase